MENVITLASLPVGRGAALERVEPGAAASGRLLDLGFTPGERVECLFEAPSGSPRAYLVRDTVIALRDTDAALVRLRV